MTFRQLLRRKGCSSMVRVALGLGSNVSYNSFEPAQLLAGACNALKRIVKAPVFSSLYETKALYYENQQNFVNMAMTGVVDDAVSPYMLLDEIHQIESNFGRNRRAEIRFGPRSLDIDIEEFGNLTMDEPELILPHPRMKERAFVLVPLLEILDESADCNKKKVLLSFLEKLSEQSVTKCSKAVQEKFKAALR